MQSVKFGRGGTVTRGEAAPEAIEQLVAAKARELAGEIKLTRAQQRLQKWQDESDEPTIIERYEILGDTWVIQRAHFEDVNLIMMMTPRDTKGRLILGAKGAMTSLLSAMLFVCCVDEEDDEKPYFESPQDALKQAKSRGKKAVEVNNILFSKILHLSPEIWPDGEEKLREMEEEADKSGGGVPLAPSISPSKTPRSGSHKTPSTT